MGITEVIYMVILLAVGFGMGWLYAKAHTMDDYNHMYSHLTCEIISRMQQAMRSMRMEQDDINRVIDRMGCKIMPTSVLTPPPSPPVKQGEQKPAEWSEDVESAIELLNDMAEEQEEDSCPHNAKDLRKAAHYLESCRPQSRWKPSEEQMRVLDLAIRCGINRGTTEETTLVSLFNDLVKLK